MPNLLTDNTFPKTLLLLGRSELSHRLDAAGEVEALMSQQPQHSTNLGRVSM